jgi:hypothetical protein
VVQVAHKNKLNIKGYKMAKLTLTRIDLSIYNKEDQTTTPARFYVRPENEVNLSIFSSLKRSLFGSKYGSTTVHAVKMTEVLNPQTNEPATVKQYSKDAGEEVDTPLMRLDSFSTGYNPDGEDKDQNYVIQLNSATFAATSKDGNDYTVTKAFERDYQGDDAGVIRNLEALQHMNASLKDDATCEATIEKNDKGTYYISKFAE